jgi:hypothetical protein
MVRLSIPKRSATSLSCLPWATSRSTSSSRRVRSGFNFVSTPRPGPSLRRPRDSPPLPELLNYFSFIILSRSHPNPPRFLTYFTRTTRWLLALLPSKACLSAINLRDDADERTRAVRTAMCPTLWEHILAPSLKGPADSEASGMPTTNRRVSARFYP